MRPGWPYAYLAEDIPIRRYAPNVRLLRSGGCWLSVTANVRAKGCRALVLACDLFMKPLLSHPGVRTSEGVDVWPLRAMRIVVEASAVDVPDNRPLSGGRVGRPEALNTGYFGWVMERLAGGRRRCPGRPR